MNDRIADLQKFTPITIIQIESESSDESDESDSPDSSDMLYDELKYLIEQCNRLEDDINLIETIYAKSVSDGTVISQDPRLDALRRDVTALSNNIRSRLEVPNAEIGTAMTRVQRTISVTITRRFIELIQRYQHLNASHRNQHHVNAHREVSIIRPDLTTEEVDDLIEHNDVAHLTVQSLVQGDRQKDKATVALLHIKERHQDIVELENALVELHEIFVDMANTIDSQGEMVNSIDYNVDQAKEWTGEAVKEITQARKYKSKERKKCCAMCASCTMLGGAMMGGIALGLAPLAACTVQ